MKKDGRRQEVLYLGFVVGALMCAVVVVLAARSYRQRPLPKEAAKQPAPATKANRAKRPAKRPVSVPSPPAGGAAARDPFASLSGGPGRAPRGSDRTREPGNRPGGAQDEGEAADLHLTGLVQGPVPMAVIKVGEDPQYVHVGEKVGVYTVVKIETRSVVVSGGGKTFTLTMHRDQSEASRRPANRRLRTLRR